MSDAPRIDRAQEQLFDRRTSAREKYAALVVGRPGWGALIKHELVTLASQSTPGALGLALRQTLYPVLLASCGRNVVFGQNVVLRHPHKIRIGDDVVIDDNCLIDAKGEANRGITIGSGVFIGRNTILSCKNGDIDVNDGANIGFNCEIFSASSISPFLQDRMVLRPMNTPLPMRMPAFEVPLASIRQLSSMTTLSAMRIL